MESREGNLPRGRSRAQKWSGQHSPKQIPGKVERVRAGHLLSPSSQHYTCVLQGVWRSSVQAVLRASHLSSISGQNEMGPWTPSPWEQNEASHQGPNWTNRGNFWFGFWEACNTGHKNFPRAMHEQLHCSSPVLVVGHYDGNQRIPSCILLQNGTEQYLWVYPWTFFHHWKWLILCRFSQTFSECQAVLRSKAVGPLHELE